MALVVGALILTVIILLFTYFLNSNKNGNKSIPFATYGSYPIVGHLFAFTKNRSQLLIECAKRYGPCFRIKLFNQYYTMIISYADWTTVIRNQSVQFNGGDFGIRIFDLSSSFVSKYIHIRIIILMNIKV